MYIVYKQYKGPVGWLQHKNNDSYLSCLAIETWKQQISDIELLW